MKEKFLLKDLLADEESHLAHFFDLLKGDYLVSREEMIQIL